MAFITNNKVVISNKQGKVWYHGSPLALTVLKKGSSITKNKNLAIAFSHKPTLLSVDLNGNIEHNGELSGYLYTIDEGLSSQDIYVHEACQNNDNWEWITTRDLKLKLVCKTE